MASVTISDSIESTGAVSNPQPEKVKKGRGKTRGLSIQKKRKNNKNVGNGKLEVLIPTDRKNAVGPGAKDFVTELSVTVDQNARHDVDTWNKVSDLAKDRIVDHMMDTFDIPKTEHSRETILAEANNLYRYHHSRLHAHFNKFATEEESLKNIPENVTEAEWKFLVDRFTSESFKRMSARNKANKAKQGMKHTCGRKSFQALSFEKRDEKTGKEPNLHELWEMTHKSNGHWVNDVAAELHDKVQELVDETVQETEECIDVDTIVNDVFVKVAGDKSRFCRSLVPGVKTATKRSMHGIQEQLLAQQKEVEEERKKRETVESKLIEVQEKLEDERKNREVMEAHLLREQKKLTDSVMALVALQTSKSGLPAALLSILTNLSGTSQDSSPTSPTEDAMDDHV